MDCIFCKIRDEKLPSYKIYEDEDFLAFLDIHPINPGHLLLIPKKHVKKYCQKSHRSASVRQSIPLGMG